MAGTRLGGRTVLVTGAGSGIGRLLALGAAERGAHLVLWDSSPERVEAVRDELGDKRTVTQVVDVSDKAAVAEAAKAAGSVGVLVNNADVVTGGPLLEATDEAIERTYAVNVLALYWVTRAFLPAMVARRAGHVVTVAAAAGLIGVARRTDYAASKHAAVGFDESLRAEMRALRTGVRTTVVCPHHVDTGTSDGVTTRWPLLLPILTPQRVATKILDAVESGRHRLVMPPLVSALPVLRALPVPLFDRAVDALGINAATGSVAGRTPTPVGKPLPLVTPDATEPA